MPDFIYEKKIIKNFRSLKPSPIKRDEKLFKDVKYHPLLTSREDDAPNFSLRIFSIGPDGHTINHKHSYEHEIYILEGDGFVYIDDAKINIKKDDCFIIYPYERHQLISGKNGMNVICIVPNRLKNQPD